MSSLCVIGAAISLKVPDTDDKLRRRKFGEVMQKSLSVETDLPASLKHQEFVLRNGAQVVEKVFSGNWRTLSG